MGILLPAVIRKSKYGPKEKSSIMYLYWGGGYGIASCGGGLIGKTRLSEILNGKKNEEIEALLIDYYECWLSRDAAKGWEQEVAAIKHRINDEAFVSIIQGRNKKAIALVLYAKALKHSDKVAAYLKLALERDNAFFDQFSEL